MQNWQTVLIDKNVTLHIAVIGYHAWDGLAGQAYFNVQIVSDKQNDDTNAVKSMEKAYNKSIALLAADQIKEDKDLSASAKGRSISLHNLNLPTYNQLNVVTNSNIPGHPYNSNLPDNWKPPAIVFNSANFKALHQNPTSPTREVIWVTNPTTGKKQILDGIVFINLNYDFLWDLNRGDGIGNNVSYQSVQGAIISAISNNASADGLVGDYLGPLYQVKFDLVGTIEHEMGHVLGFHSNTQFIEDGNVSDPYVGGVTAFDLFTISTIDESALLAGNPLPLASIPYNQLNLIPRNITTTDCSNIHTEYLRDGVGNILYDNLTLGGTTLPMSYCAPFPGDKGGTNHRGFLAGYNPISRDVQILPLYKSTGTQIWFDFRDPVGHLESPAAFFGPGEQIIQPISPSYVNGFPTRPSPLMSQIIDFDQSRMMSKDDLMVLDNLGFDVDYTKLNQIDRPLDLSKITYVNENQIGKDNVPATAETEPQLSVNYKVEGSLVKLKEKIEK